MKTLTVIVLGWNGLALTRATLRGGLWADAQENRADLIALLARSGFVDAPPALIAP